MSYNVATMPLTWRHIRIVGIASLGQLIGTAVATIAGIIIPLLNIIMHPELSSFMQGLIGAIDLVGICIGSVVFGRLSDKYGYLLFFRLCPALIFVASTLAIFCGNVAMLTICLFFVGFGIGGEYSLDSGYVSELMPDKYKSLMVGVTKTASALGNIIAAAVSFWLLISWGSATLWPRLLWTVSVIAMVMLLLRIRFWESPAWLIAKGRTQEAQEVVEKFLGKDVRLETDGSIASEPNSSARVNESNHSSARVNESNSFFKGNWKRIVLSGIPWACEGLGVYGIGVFLPILVMALGLEKFGPGDAAILHVTDSVKITLYISCIILPGFISGLILIRKGGSITAIQTWGFLLCALALGVLMPAYELHWNKWIAIGSFMAFEFFLNMGPHLITYVLPPKIYPVAERGRGVGIAAAIGKIGAVLGVFVIPILLEAGGALLVLGVSAGVMALGAIVTFAFRGVMKES